MAAFAVLGVGNNLLTDDGVGIHVLNAVGRTSRYPDTALIDAGTVGLALASHLADLDGLVAVDAMRLGKEPGCVSVFEGTDMDAQLRRHHGSVHELGLSDLVDALRLSDALPDRRAIVGIEPASLDWGTEPTEAVARAIPKAVDSIERLLNAWRSTQQAEDAA